MSISDIEFAKMSYKDKIGGELDLDNPCTFDEKLWYLKLSNRDPLLTKCSDKYLVREYVEECGLGHILNELYGVYDDAKDIDFDRLPPSCFFKCNHTSGYNIIFDRDKPFDKKDFIRKFNFILHQNYYWVSREWNYKNIKPKIVAEKVIRDDKGKLPVDYKFLCFDGIPKLMYLALGTCTESGAHAKVDDRYINTYDMNFSLTEIEEGFPIYRGYVEKPKTFELMKEYAAILSAPFPHCRVDFYENMGQIIFGEITFYDGGGCNNIQPKEWDIKVGEWINLSGYKIALDALSPDRI